MVDHCDADVLVVGRSCMVRMSYLDSIRWVRRWQLVLRGARSLVSQGWAPRCLPRIERRSNPNASGGTIPGLEQGVHNVPPSVIKYHVVVFGLGNRPGAVHRVPPSATACTNRRCRPPSCPPCTTTCHLGRGQRQQSRYAMARAGGARATQRELKFGRLRPKPYG